MSSHTGSSAADPFLPGPFQPKDPDFEARFHRAVQAQPFLVHIGAEMIDVKPGQVTLGANLTRELTQNLGFAHGGVSATLLDVAGGFSSGTLAPIGFTVLTVELKINLLAPGKGVRLLAHGRVIKPGRTLTIAESRIVSVDADGSETLVGTALGTFMNAAAPKPEQAM